MATPLLVRSLSLTAAAWKPYGDREYGNNPSLVLFFSTAKIEVANNTPLISK